MLSLRTNFTSLIAQNSLNESTNRLNQAIERMTTGFKINHAKDNAANYSIATNMTTKMNSLLVAEDNASMGLDLVSTAEGVLEQIQDKLQRIRDLQEQRRETVSPTRKFFTRCSLRSTPTTLPISMLP